MCGLKIAWSLKLTLILNDRERQGLVLPLSAPTVGQWRTLGLSLWLLCSLAV